MGRSCSEVNMRMDVDTKLAVGNCAIAGCNMCFGDIPVRIPSYMRISLATVERMCHLSHPW